MQKFQNNIQDQFGNEVSGATITVRDVVGGALSTIFSDDGVTPLANPFIAQDLSEFFFYAFNSRYDIFITGPVTDQSLDVILFDPFGTGAILPFDLGDFDGSNNQQIRFGDSQDTLMFFDGTDFIIQAVSGNLVLQGEIFGTGSLYLTEKSAAGADIVTLGQFWVRDDAPNTPMFTDDAGNDFVLNVTSPMGSVVDSTVRFNGSAFIEETQVRISAAGVLTVLDATLVENVTLLTSLTEAKLESTQDLIIKTLDSFISFNIGANNALTIQNNIVRVNTDSGGFLEIRDDIGNNVQLTTTSLSLNYQFSANVKSIRYFDGISIFMEEKAAAESDAAGSGQFWVRDDAPNTPMFTDDLGTDFELNVLPGAVLFRGALAFSTTSLTLSTVTETLIPFNSEAFDTDSIHDTVSNTGRLTVPAGVTKIRLKGSVTWQLNNTGYRQLRIFKNGVAANVDDNRGSYIPTILLGAGGATIPLGMEIFTGVIECVATDFFTLHAEHNRSGNLDLLAAQSWFEMEIIN